jgi:hypothetical protein
MHTSFVSKTALTVISVACIAFGTGSALGPSGADAYTGTLPLPPSTSAPAPSPSAEPTGLPISSVPAAVSSSAPAPAAPAPSTGATQTAPAPAAVAPAVATTPVPAVSSKPRTVPRARSCERKKAHSKRCLPGSKRRRGAAHPKVGARAASYDWVFVTDLLDGNVIDGINYWYVWEEVNSGALFYSFYECDAGCQYTGDNWFLYGDTWYYERSGVWYQD